MVPEANAVIAPVTGSTVATEGFALVHTPPVTASLNLAPGTPTHIVAGTMIFPGFGATVSTCPIEHPVDANVNRMVVVPDVTPVATPDVAPMVATAGNELLHVPVPELVKVVSCPTHTVVPPLIGPGNGLIVRILVAIQPVGNI